MKSAFQEMTTQVVVAIQTAVRGTKGHTPEKERMDTPPEQRENVKPRYEKSREARAITVEKL
jgi:hypothetical protein